jgi:heme-degrading monooxygenase HmoA
MLVDRATGKYLSITLWESEAAQQQNAGSAGQSSGRQAMTVKYFEAPPTPSTFEVVGVIE